jgi:hypothetical protein
MPNGGWVIIVPANQNRSQKQDRKEAVKKSKNASTIPLLNSNFDPKKRWAYSLELAKKINKCHEATLKLLVASFLILAWTFKK